jgi:hypothetical protein
MNSNQVSPNLASLSQISSLEDRLLDCIGSEDHVAVIRALVATRDPAAIRVLASLLDSVGPIGEEAIAGLLTFGDEAIPAMRECVDSLDYDMIRHGHQGLATLGDAASVQWLRDDHAERIAAYRERLGFPFILLEVFGANETDEPSRVA